MGEQRYKVGDWVRVKDNRGAPRDYKVGDVCQVTKIEDDIVRCGKAGMFDYRFEPWQPRVGERVRTISGGDFEYIGVEGIIEANDGATDRNLRVKLDKPIEKWGDTKIWRSARHLEPILTTTAPEQPTTLKIEAGKFYKTRDGRKVGPMVVDDWHSHDYGWTVKHDFNAEYAKAWRSDGTFDVTRGRKHNADLIAEWIDEPAAKAKASNDNAQPKFKVGDRVVLIADNPQSPRFGVKGAIGEVGSIENGSARVIFETGPHVGDFWYVPISVLAAYSATATITATTTIVALIENGQPKPSSTPHLHATTGAAEREAKRLAAKFKGKQFGVFTLTTTHEEAAPVYDHKWQNLAMLGLKIDAIKELRSFTGIGLKPAKDAVEYFLDAA